MNVTLLITTWPNHPARLDYCLRTIEALRARFCSGAWHLELLVSAESQKDPGQEWQGDELARALEGMAIPLRWRHGPACLAQHLNEAIAACTSDLVFHCQDDWELHRVVDIEEAACVLDARQDLAGVRYWATHCRYLERVERWIEIDRGSTWSYGDNPGLWHKRFFAAIGPFTSEGDFGTHEIRASERLRKTGLRVLAPPQVAEDASYYFRHIGTVTSVINDQRYPGEKRR